MEEQIVRDSIPDAGDWLLMNTDSVCEPEFYITSQLPLHHGSQIPVNPLHTDWITGLLLLSAILYIVVTTFARNLFADIIRVVTFSSRSKEVADSRGIFHWQTTLANLASFIILSIFLCMLLTEKGVGLPGTIHGFLLWFLLLLSVSLSVTVRHLTTVLVGNLSGRHTIFAEYLNNIYSLYRLIGIALFPIIITISYSTILDAATLINTGLGIITLVFTIRIISLLIIFIRGGVRIFYFLLYLCALEIMPGLILLKLATS